MSLLSYKHFTVQPKYENLYVLQKPAVNKTPQKFNISSFFLVPFFIQVQQHQLALGLSSEWSLLGDGWIPPLFWFSEPSLHDGAPSPRPVPGGSWETISPARLRQPSLSSSGHHHCHLGGLNTLTPLLLTNLWVRSAGVKLLSASVCVCGGGWVSVFVSFHFSSETSSTKQQSIHLQRILH